MSMVADVVDAVVGGDTHRDSHALEIVSSVGATLAAITVTNDRSGFADAIAFVTAHAPGPRVVVGLEGTRSYGVGLARAMQAAGLMVVEVPRPRREDRVRGKSDPIDARLAALAVLRLDAARLPAPRADGDREALRILLTARHDLTAGKTRQVNQLRALLLSGNDADRVLARGTLNQAVLSRIARRRGSAVESFEQTVRRHELRRLAGALRTVEQELAVNKRQLITAINRIAPAVLDRDGVGPVSAARVIVSWSHRGRCRNEAAFAALAGVCPIPASSGRIVRHRLNRGGDRSLNLAIHTIVLTRWRTNDRTRTYIARRRSEGMNDSEIRRTLKRYVARELYRVLNDTTLLARG